jgi:hypothetical protein
MALLIVWCIDRIFARCYSKSTSTQASLLGSAFQKDQL